MKNILFLFFLLPFHAVLAQEFSRADSLRGSLNEFRSNFDVKYYHLVLEIFPENKSIAGSNTILFEALANMYKIQIDLFENMQVNGIYYQNQALKFEREGNVIWIYWDQAVPKGSIANIKIDYEGQPTIAKRAPWDGGFTWANDVDQRLWLGVSCEGIGASLWWPNKDHLSDEPDSMLVSTIVPNPLISVGNGRLRKQSNLGNGKSQFDWFVSSPINNYNISLNVAHYAHWQDQHRYTDGTMLDLDYYVLDYNLDKAKAHFDQVKPMLDAFSHYFGPYPFLKDGYKMVETPYWGMEHQSAIAYGNNYKNNEFGFDFIIVHESGHEYFGNAVSVADHADMWIHEAFTTYMEALYLEYLKDKATAIAWMETQKKRIGNKMAIQGPRGVNFGDWPDADMYFKGTWMLHSIRHTINNDALWFEILRKTYDQFKFTNTHSEAVIDYMNSLSPVNLKPIFRQYLEELNPPTLEYEWVQKGQKTQLRYRWQAVEGFAMPLEIRLDDKTEMRLKANTEWNKVTLKNANSQPQFRTDLYYFLVNEMGKE